MLRAGAAMVDITPWAGVHLAGAAFGEYRPAETVLDRLYAKALAIESGGHLVCIITLDVVLITEEYTRQIRAMIAEAHGVEYDAILVSATQTHSAPGVGRFMFDPDMPLDLAADAAHLGGEDPAYSAFAAESAIRAATEAIGKLAPVQVGAGRGVADKLAFNRRMITRDGGLVMPGFWDATVDPVGPVNMLHYEGPTDPEVGVIAFRDDRLNMVALLLHFTCHPVNAFSQNRSWHAVSSDWPGVWAEEARRAWGDGCVPIVLNGCCGNLNPWDPFEPNFVPDHRRMGRALHRVSENVVKRMRFAAEDRLAYTQFTIPLPYREVPETRRAAVDRILAAYPSPQFEAMDAAAAMEWCLAASTKSIDYCRKRSAEFPYEVHAFRIGECAVIGLPGEPFVEGQLAIKMQSPARCVQIAHVATQYVGYLPTRDAYARGGHEANFDCTYWAKVGSGALETVVERVRAAIDGLFAT